MPPSPHHTTHPHAHNASRDPLAWPRRVHEFAHTVMNVGLSEEAKGRVRAAYEDALANGVVVKDSYMGSSADEYWAEGTQAWFQASARADVNEGMLTQRLLERTNPALAACLVEAFGGGCGAETAGNRKEREAAAAGGEGTAAETRVWNYTMEELASPTRELWLRRQATYLLLRHLLLTNADALADIVERVVARQP